jgi:hypothetical protein
MACFRRCTKLRLPAEGDVVTDFLDDKRSEIERRLSELKPLADEYHRLEAAASALAEVAGPAAALVVPVRRRPGRRSAALSRTASTSSTITPAKRRGRPPGRKKAGRAAGRKKVGRPPGGTAKAAPVAVRTAAGAAPATGRRRPGRRKGSGTRSAQALRIVKGQPGITIPELAVKMGINQNYLYRVLPALEQEGKISKQGRGWYPARSYRVAAA